MLITGLIICEETAPGSKEAQRRPHGNTRLNQYLTNQSLFTHAESQTGHVLEINRKSRNWQDVMNVDV